MGWLIRDKEIARTQLKNRVQFAKGLLALGIGFAGIFLLFQVTAYGRPEGGHCLAKRSIYDAEAYSSRVRRETDDLVPCTDPSPQCKEYVANFDEQYLQCTRGLSNSTKGCTEDAIKKEKEDAAACIKVLEEDYGSDYYKSGIYWCDVTDFPDSLFTIGQRQNGAFMVYGIGLIYMFLALAIVCDEYFVPALECVTEKLSLSDDVAGATFMAAGGSAPELFTSVIGVFVADSNVGIGTIVGSAVFNILFVLGMCAFIVGFQIDPATGVGTVLNLTWFPLSRDCFFYVFSLVVLVVSFSGDEIMWYESLSMIGVYVAYVVFMMFNAKIEAALTKKSDAPVHEEQAMQQAPLNETAGAGGTQIANKWSLAAKAATAHMHFHTRTILGLTTQNPEGSDIEGSSGGVVAAYAIARFYAIRRRGGPPGAQQAGGGGGQTEAVRFSLITSPWRTTKIDPIAQARCMSTPCGPDAPTIESLRRQYAGNISAAKVVEKVNQTPDPATEYPKPDQPKSELPVPDTSIAWASSIWDDEDGLPGSSCQLKCPKLKPGRGCSGFLKYVMHILIMPIVICLKLTIPDSRYKSVRDACSGRLYILSFFASIIWISIFSWLMVWWVTRIGETWNIDPMLMGLTFLAAGTSIPDLITSVIVSRAGHGDMAISSSIGSNIFDVTIGLPVPWFLFSCLSHKLTKYSPRLEQWAPVGVSSKGIVCSIGLLLLMLFTLVSTIISTNWQMNRPLGFMMLLLYAVFVVISLLFEYGTLTCPDIF